MNIVLKAVNIQWDMDIDDEYMLDLLYRSSRTIEIPLEQCPKLLDLDGISDYISYESGWCHYGFELECNASVDELYAEIDRIDKELVKEYADGETCHAANLECLREEIEALVCIMEEYDRIREFSELVSLDKDKDVDLD